MIHPSVKAILFDLGGVLINLNYQNTIDAFQNLGIKNFNELYTQAQQNKLFDDYEIGRVSSFHFINRILDLMPPGSNPNQVVHAWNAMILDFPETRLNVLDRLKNGYRLYLLSNTNDLHMEKVRRELGKTSVRHLEDYFDGVFLSQELGMRKPNPETFLEVASKMGVEPEEILFIDDSIQHVESAKNLGFQVLHLTIPLEDHPYFS